MLLVLACEGGVKFAQNPEDTSSDVAELKSVP